MNGLLVRDAGDVEKQKLCVERPGDFVITKHLSLEHRWSGAAADGEGQHARDKVADCTTVRDHPAIPVQQESIT